MTTIALPSAFLISTTAIASSPTTTSVTCGAQLYNMPTTDAACAVPSKSNYTDVLQQCCNAAPVTSYYNDCGLYCLAVGQSVHDLSTCFTSNGVSYGDAFCNANETATATGKVDSATKTGAGATGTSTGQEGVAVRGVSKSGLGMLGVVVLGMVVGVLV